MRQVLTIIGRIVRLVFLLLLLIPVLGPPLYVELKGPVAPGTIVAKREEVRVRANTWSRTPYVDVRYQPADTGEPERAPIAVTSAIYDQLRVGDQVAVRYMPVPALRGLGYLDSPRLQSQPALGSFTARISGELLGFGVGIALFCALVWAWNRWRHWALAAAAFGLMFGGLAYLESGWLGPVPEGELIPSRATVRGQHQVTRVWESPRSTGREAVQPYTIVELVFVPDGASDPVVAVDHIDTRSVPGLELGADVPIEYSASDPRWARISGASRTYHWKNLLDLVITGVVLGGFLIALVWAGQRLFGRRRTRLPLP